MGGIRGGRLATVDGPGPDVGEEERPGEGDRAGRGHQPVHPTSPVLRTGDRCTMTPAGDLLADVQQEH